MRRDLGVSMESVGPTPPDRLIEGIIRTVDDYQRSLHSEDTRRGIAAARRRRQGC